MFTNELKWIVRNGYLRIAIGNLYYGEVQRRLYLLKCLFQRKNLVPFGEILANIFRSPQFLRGREKIKKIEKDINYSLIYLKDYSSPLYYPNNILVYWLYGVISDILYKDSWHYYETPETKVENDDIVADCGSAEGLFSFTVASRCKKVYAIEPLPSFIKALNLTFKNFKNVEILPYFLSDQREGKKTIDNCLDISSLAARKKISVRTVSLDYLFYDKKIPITYIKADLEGSDLMMLKGASKLIKKYYPKIAITTYHQDDHAKLMMEYLRGLNSNYKFKLNGIMPENGRSIMLHAWVKKVK